ncbi:helix-turn-helix domain-containing protein [Bacillus sp. AK128]
MNAVLLGEEIKRLRKKYGYSQQQLADGICTQPTISGIEAGKVYPSIDILYSLSLRLKVGLDYFITILLNESELYINETIDYINERLKLKEYKEILSITSFERKQNMNRGYQFSQFISWVHLISSYHTGAMNWRECIHQLQSLQDLTHPLYGRGLEDFKIQNSIAIIYAENGEYVTSLSHYHELLDQKDFLRQQPKFLLKLLYNLSKTYYMNQQFEQSLYYASEGIIHSVKTEDMSVLGQLYFQKGMALEKLNRSLEEAKNCYQSSYIIFKMLNREGFTEMVVNQKGSMIDITS